MSRVIAQTLGRHSLRGRRERALAAAALVLLIVLVGDRVWRGLLSPARTNLAARIETQERLVRARRELLAQTPPSVHASAHEPGPASTSRRRVESQAQLLDELSAIAQGKVALTSIDPAASTGLAYESMTVNLEGRGALQGIEQWMTAISDELGATILSWSLRPLQDAEHMLTWRMQIRISHE